MKRFTLITLISLVFLEAYSQSDMLDKLREANVDPEEIARDYFTKAELNYNQNNFEAALEYIKKAENELGTTNARILNLKVKTLWNYGRFDECTEALTLFLNEYKDSATPEVLSETRSFYTKLKTYYEKKQIEEDKKADEKRKKEESLKHYKYVSCPNGSCSYGKVDEHYYEDCYSCDGSGQITKYNYAQAFSNGLNGTNYNTAYKVTCTKCNGSGRLKQTKKVNCPTCDGENKILKYAGSSFIPSDEQDYAIKYKRKEIDYYIDLQSEISKNSSQKIFAMKDFSSGKYGLCNRNLSLIIPYRYDKAEVISTDIAIVSINSKSGLINSENTILLPLEYSEIRKLSSSSLLVKKSNDWYMSDYKGSPKGQSVDSYSAYGDYLMVFKKGGMYGVMDFNGKITESPSFTDYEVISWNPFLVSFKKGNDWYLKNLTSSVNDLYNEGFAEIKKYSSGGNSILLLKGTKSKLANLNGSLVSSEGFANVEYHESSDVFILQQGYLYGLYDLSYQSYVSPKYSELYINKDNPNRALVVRSGLYGVIDFRGNTIISTTKNRIWFNEGKNQFIVREKENSKKRYLYDENGKFLYDYKN